MKISFRISLLVLFSFLLMASCRKKGDNEHLDLHDNKDATDLFPMDSGSWWLMRDQDNNETTWHATGRDSIVDSAKWNYFYIESSTHYILAPRFFAKNDPYYLSLVDITQGDGVYVPTIICPIEPKSSDTWLNTGKIKYQGIPVDVKIKGKVVAIHDTVTYYGHTYTDVVKTENKLQGKAAILPTWTNCGTITMEFKKGVGIISQDIDVHVLSIINTQQHNELVDYHIGK